MIRFLASLGVIVVVVTIDAVIGGTVSAFWGDKWGGRAHNFAMFGFAIYGIDCWLARFRA